MPRTGRLLTDGAIYHVLTRGNNGQPVFRQEDDYKQYLELVATHFRAHDVKLFHFSLLPNYAHLLVQPSKGSELSKAMFGINLSYARLFQKRYQYAGHLWQGRFRSIPVCRDSHLLECGRYIELSAVRAGIAEDPAAYPWSSFGIYAGGASHSAVTPNPLHGALGTTHAACQTAYRVFVQAALPNEPRAVRQTESQSFTMMVRDLEMRFAPQGNRPKRGRPRKLRAAVRLGTMLFVGLLSGKRSRARQGRLQYPRLLWQQMCAALLAVSAVEYT